MLAMLPLIYSVILFRSYFRSYFCCHMVSFGVISRHIGLYTDHDHIRSKSLFPLGKLVAGEGLEPFDTRIMIPLL